MGARGVNYNHAKIGSEWTATEIAEQVVAELRGYEDDGQPITDSYVEYLDVEGTAWATASLANASSVRIELAAEAEQEYELRFYEDFDDPAPPTPQEIAALLMNCLINTETVYVHLGCEWERLGVNILLKQGFIQLCGRHGVERIFKATGKGLYFINKKRAARSRHS